jgi:predicted AlkP superfamily phosphohydrolase/phosphomutase
LSRTRAYYPEVNNGYLLINSTDRKNGIVTATERAEVLERAGTALLALKDDGTPVVRGLHDARAEGARLGIGGEAGGDLYIELSPGFDFDPRLGSGDIVVAPSPYGSHGTNPTRASMRTIMAFSGPGVARGKKLRGVRLIDFAPTIARLVSLPAPKNASGRVLEEALNPAASDGRCPSRGEPRAPKGVGECP